MSDEDENEDIDEVTLMITCQGKYYRFEFAVRSFGIRQNLLLVLATYTVAGVLEYDAIATPLFENSTLYQSQFLETMTLASNPTLKNLCLRTNKAVFLKLI